MTSPAPLLAAADGKYPAPMPGITKTREYQRAGPGQARASDPGGQGGQAEDALAVGDVEIPLLDLAQVEFQAEQRRRQLAFLFRAAVQFVFVDLESEDLQRLVGRVAEPILFHAEQAGSPVMQTILSALCL